MKHSMEYDVTTIEGLRQFQVDHQAKVLAESVILHNFLYTHPYKATEKLLKRERALTRMNQQLERIVEGLLKNMKS